YLIWPLILFFPMWAAPVLLPDLADPSQSYGELTLLLLPSGLVGLVIASLFANTMSMTSSDINTIAAVISRDILPTISAKIHSNSLKIARTVTFVFTSMTILVALQYEYFGGVLGLIISWFGALVGPIAVPLLLGLVPAFRTCGPGAAISSVLAGLMAFILTKNVEIGSLAIQVSLPLMISFITFVTIGLLSKRKIPEKVSNMFSQLNQN
ncbi:MAG: Na+:solute symporter, partial [Cyclobacteriaceae bacterium]|nr:Na+:solute symporter [Cyclobacteriaceae bacterium]